MFPYLLSQMGIRDELNQIIDGVDGGVDGLEPLDLLAYGQGVGHVGDVAPPVGPHHGGEERITGRELVSQELTSCKK
jgi:hypothetical protein